MHLVNAVTSGPETFGQPCRQGMPDLVAHFRDGVFGQVSPHGETVAERPAVDAGPMALLGTHTRAGVLVVHGPNVAAGTTLDADIVDIAPTVLAWLGLPVPRHMDGHPLQQAFTTFPEVTFSDGSGRTPRVTQYTEAEQADVEKRLGDLGYL